MMEPADNADANQQNGQHGFRPELRAVDPPEDERADSIDFDSRVFALARRLVETSQDHAYLAPYIPPPVLGTALQGYLELQDGEVLLAVVGVPQKGSAQLGCALTTKRIYWPGEHRNSSGAGPPRCQSLVYAALPENIKRIGTGEIDLGDGRWFATTGSSILRTALIEFLGAARAITRGEALPQPISVREIQNTRLVWPRVAAATLQSRSLQSEIRQFEDSMLRASRPVVTAAIVVACAAVYVAMVVTGVSPLEPKLDQLFAWGANSGPSVMIDHEFWRLFTSIFIHFGLLHILMNMLCLVSAGPLVERLFGHFGFAALYVLSGLGGSIVSVWSQPMAIIAGASGAIFGTFGGLLGFLAIRHAEIPFSILRRLRGGAIGFVAYNILFSAFVPGISMAAHLGGLVTGFFCGLLMTVVSPGDVRARSGLTPALLQAGVAGLVAVGLAVLGYTGLDSGKAKILADPQIGAELNAAPAFNAFTAAAKPVYSEFDRIYREIQKLGPDLESGRRGKPELTEALRRLKSESDTLADRIRAIPADNSELQAIRVQLASAQSGQKKLLDSFEQFLDTGNENHINGPAGFRASDEALNKHLTESISLHGAYIKAHHLRPAKGEKSPKP